MPKMKWIFTALAVVFRCAIHESNAHDPTGAPGHDLMPPTRRHRNRPHPARGLSERHSYANPVAVYSHIAPVSWLVAAT